MMNAGTEATEKEPAMRAQPLVLAAGWRQARWAPYAVSALATVATTILLTLVQHGLNLFNVSLLYLATVLLCAISNGLGPGVVAAVIALFTFDWFFLPPVHTVTITNPQD